MVKIFRPNHYMHRFHAKRKFGKRIRFSKQRDFFYIYLTLPNDEILCAGADRETFPDFRVDLERAALDHLEQQLDAFNKRGIFV